MSSSRARFGVPSGFGRKCTSAAGNALLGKDEAFLRNGNQDAVHARTIRRVHERSGYASLE